MANIKQLRNRIRSIKSTKKITQAMHLVAAAKLKKAKNALSNQQNYKHSLDIILQVMHNNNKLAEIASLQRVTDGSALLLFVSSEKGLCGGFNINLFKKLQTDIELRLNRHQAVQIITIGKKGTELVRRKYPELLLASYEFPADVNELVPYLRSQLTNFLAHNKFSSYNVYYNQFKNAMLQIAKAEQIWPIEFSNPKQSADEHYSYEGEDVVMEAVKLYFSSKINHALLQSQASEEGARMTAMDNATNNAADLIDKLTLQMNRSRQAIITTELTEIISGAEAV